ncbi:MAG: site-specific integrase [Chitinophagales bacterium]|nr:site-specific integrase [Chitinophagales bacterium]
MYTDPQIVSTNSLETRAYVKVYIDGERHRYYNGKAIGINCNPNHAKTIKERNRALTTLCYTLKKLLDSGWKPSDIRSIEPVPKEPEGTAGDIFTRLLLELEEQDLSKLYKRDISSVGTNFIRYLKENSLYNMPNSRLNSTHIERFLKQYNHSATYYMNKRRTLGGIFSRLVTQKIIDTNPVHETSQLKEKATLHQAYTKSQLMTVFDYLRLHSPNLYLCSMLMYGCLLRPHQEVRQLFRSDFNEDCSVIALSGENNKSGRIRTVHVPLYVHEVLLQQGIPQYEPSRNIFTGTGCIYNESYFNTTWSRIKEKLVNDGVIGDNHTLYSFRHTAAVNLYMKTKDLFKVQQALGHSSMTVTLTYMRSLGIMNATTADDVPDL